MINNRDNESLSTKDDSSPNLLSDLELQRVSDEIIEKNRQLYEKRAEL